MAEPIEPQGGGSSVVPDSAPANPSAGTKPVSKYPASPNGKPNGKPNGQPNGQPNGKTTTFRPPPRQKYSLPLPVRTFPLPTFYPSNPLSLVHLAWAWASQVLGRPSSLPAQKVYTGTWCPATRSVQVSDPASMNDLWCQGFFGKGSLSRSEPSWLMRERERERDRDKDKDKDKTTSEQRTNRRREERADTKWERGRAALEAVEKRKQEEAAAAAAAATTAAELINNGRVPKAPVGPLELLALPNSEADLVAREQLWRGEAGRENGNGAAHVNGSAAAGKDETTVLADEEVQETLLPDVKRQKCVRFSATVESTTFAKSDPPSPSTKDLSADTSTPSTTGTNASAAPVIVNKEHLQLAPEEAFFLAFAVGALRVVDEAGRAFSHSELFWLFSEHATFPPNNTDKTHFITHYSVYHHFRALGWTPRHGMKFGVDWLLYGKGPALDHAEFGVMVMASSDGEPGPNTSKSWHWLHSVNRVLSTVYKSMVLVYVDVPEVPAGKADVDVASLLRAVKIRSVMVRRWSSNRNRD